LRSHVTRLRARYREMLPAGRRQLRASRPFHPAWLTQRAQLNTASTSAGETCTRKTSSNPSWSFSSR
jgi:hypothetical protein